MAARPAAATAPARPSAEGRAQGDVDQRLQGEPLRGEAVERRHPGDRHRPDQKGPAGPRHAPQQPAETVEIEGAHRALEGARRQEQQRLEHRVVEDVEERRRERDRRPGRLAVGGEEDRGAEAERDDPDVLDRVKGQQPLQVVLHQRVENTAQRRQQAQPEHSQARPQGGRVGPLEEHADQPVEGDLDHHPRHQGRDVARRDGVGTRQPGVHRHQARLGAEADQGGGYDQRLHPSPLGGERPGIAQRSVVGEREHADPDAGAAQVSYREVDEDGMTHPGIAAAHEYGCRRRQCHQLPEGEERGGVACRHDPGEGDQEQPAEGDLDTVVGETGQVVAGVEERGHRNDRDGRQEEAGEPVDSQRRAEAVAKLGADRRSAEEDEGAAGSQQRDARRLQSQRGGKGGACKRCQRSGAQQQRAEHGKQFQTVQARGLPARGKTLD